MVEHPILFSGPMVRAILEGRKTQTRRVIKRPPVPYEWPTDGPQFAFLAKDYPSLKKMGHIAVGLQHNAWVCPYGSVGDRLWVRETWAYHLSADREKSVQEWVKEEASEGRLHLDFRASGHMQTGCGGAAGRWRPSIHQPRWASRILLEVTEVRVQRLNDIDDDDALAEGLKDTLQWGDETVKENRYEVGDIKSSDAIECYALLWDSINGEGSWDTNPWVWAVSFRRIQP